MNLSFKSSLTFTVHNAWCKFNLWNKSRGQDLNYGTIYKQKTAKQSWHTDKVDKNGSAHLMAKTPIQSVAAGGKNSQHLQMLVAGCELMPAQWLLTLDVYAGTDADSAEETIFGLQHFLRILYHLLNLRRITTFRLHSFYFKITRATLTKLQKSTSRVRIRRVLQEDISREWWTSWKKEINIVFIKR